MRLLASTVLLGCLTLLGVGAVPAHAQSTPGAALLGRAGWNALESGRPQDAADAFRKAIADDPRDARLRLGAGIAAHLLGHPDEAQQALEVALRLDPSLADASVLLGQLAYRAGDLQRAMRVYEDALALTPDHRRMRETLARWRREAALHDAFDRKISHNFTVLFEGPAEQPLAERALEDLEAAYWRVAPVLGIHPTQPITVVLYTSEQFRDITRAPAWAAGAFDGTIRVPMRNALERPGELQRVLAHELTHALVWSVAPRGVPTWLTEGLAVVFEGEGLNSRDGSPLSDRPILPLARLHGSFGALTNTQAAAAYTQSGLAARALLDLIGGAGITNILADLAAGVDFDAAFAKRAPLSYEDFQARWPELADAPPLLSR